MRARWTRWVSAWFFALLGLGSLLAADAEPRETRAELDGRVAPRRALDPLAASVERLRRDFEAFAKPRGIEFVLESYPGPRSRRALRRRWHAVARTWEGRWDLSRPSRLRGQGGLFVGFSAPSRRALLQWRFGGRRAYPEGLPGMVEFSAGSLPELEALLEALRCRLEVFSRPRRLPGENLDLKKCLLGSRISIPATQSNQLFDRLARFKVAEKAPPKLPRPPKAPPSSLGSLVFWVPASLGLLLALLGLYPKEPAEDLLPEAGEDPPPPRLPTPGSPTALEAVEAMLETMPELEVSLARSTDRDLSQFRCPYCGEADLELELVHCPRCDSLHHRECFEENSGCTTYACRN